MKLWLQISDKLGHRCTVNSNKTLNSINYDLNNVTMCLPNKMVEILT